MSHVLLIDNYDSFTHNLAQLLGTLGAQVTVARNDAIDLPQIRQLSPTHVVLSPGPGHPAVERDFGICAALIHALEPSTAMLGVCLGHQGIVHHLGGQVVRAPQIVHGKTSLIAHDGQGLFAGLEEKLEVMRYHSLVADPQHIPPSLRVTATTADGLVMAVEHRTLPIFGVQFHPESIGTPRGDRVVANFLKIGAQA